MKLTVSEAMALVDALKSFVGHEIAVTEHISRFRSGGYDRHHTTMSRFSFLADAFFGISISGELFGIESKGGSNLYCFSLRSIVEFHWEAEKLIIVEYFEEETARHTTIHHIDQSENKSTAEYEAEFDRLMQEAAGLNEFMAQDRVEIEQLKVETKVIRDETRALLTSMGAKL